MLLSSILSLSHGNDASLHFASEDSEIQDYACEVDGYIPEWLQGTLVICYDYCSIYTYFIVISV